MGLDMYAYTLKAAPDSDVDFEAIDPQELHYWRKHPNLHGWMEILYRAKDGIRTNFNCVNLVLTSQDIDRLEADILDGTLPETTGFFFGESDGSEREDDLLFVSKARAALASGLTVIYSSWW